MQERATQLQGQEARQRAETQRGDQQAWDADAERPRRSCGGQPHVPDVRSEDRGDVRPQAPARFRGARLSESTSSDKAVWMRAAYQRRFPFGWHELWWQARGTLLAGGVLFPDEESIGSYLHGSFAGSDFARKLASTGFELRYSLLRDVIKVGFLYDQLVFGAIDRTPNPSPWRPQAQAGRRCICSWQTSSRWTSILRWDGRPTAARTSPPPSCCGRCSDVVQRIANDPSLQSGPRRSFPCRPGSS